MLSRADRLEAMRRFKHPKTKSHESVARWADAYSREGLAGLKAEPGEGGATLCGT